MSVSCAGNPSFSCDMDIASGDRAHYISRGKFASHIIRHAIKCVTRVQCECDRFYMVVYDERARRDKKSLNKVLTFFVLACFLSSDRIERREREKNCLIYILVSFDCADVCMNGHTDNLLTPHSLSLSHTHRVSGKMAVSDGGGRA